MGPGMISGVQVSGGCSSNSIYLIIHCPLTEHQLPVQRTCGHVKSSRHDDHLSSFVHHQPGKFRETKVVADAKAHLSKFCVKNRHLVPWCQGIGFFKILAAFYIDVKKMHLPVLTDLMAISVKYIGSVINIAGIVSFRHASGYEINSAIFCYPGAFSPGISPLWFGIFRKVFIFVGTAEHFGQDCQIDSLKLRAGKKFCRLGNVAKFISIYMCLKNCSFYNCHIIMSLLLQRKLSICHIDAG